jgi:hypothetical protein
MGFFPQRLLFRREGFEANQVTVDRSHKVGHLVGLVDLDRLDTGQALQ